MPWTSRVLTGQQLDAFWRDGFLIVEDLVDPDLINRMAQQVDLIASGKASNIPDTFINLEKQFDAAGGAGYEDRNQTRRPI